MTTYHLPALDWAAPIVDPRTGRPSPYFQRFWQNVSLTSADAANGSTTNLSDQLAAKVDKNSQTGWASPSGTLDKTTFATYAAPTISNPPTQAEVQALANHVQVLSQHLAAAINALKAAQVFGS